MDSLTHIVGGATIQLQSEGTTGSNHWLLIPDSVLNDFRLDFYDIDGQRLAVVTQKCNVKPPLKFDARAVLKRKPRGTYFVTLSCNGTPIGTARYEWRR